MVRQRGFGLLAYGLLALAILGALGGMGSSIRKTGYDAARAELQPQLEHCHGEIKRQNDAVAALKAESDRKQAAASKALAKATVSAKVWEDNAARLRAVLTAPRKPGEPAPTTCEAAWAKIRGAK